MESSTTNNKKYNINMDGISKGVFEMTDISNWSSTIHTKHEELTDVEIATHRKYFPDYKGICGSEYAMMPMDMSGYQLGNLLWLLRKHPEDDTGDWYYEMISVIQVTCTKLGIIPYANMQTDKDTEFNKDVEWIKQEIKKND